MAFNLSQLFDFLDSIREYKEEKRYKIMRNYLTSEDFFKWLFNPLEQDTKYGNLEQQFSKLYEKVGSKKVIKAIIETIYEYGYDDFSRTTSVFIFSIVKFGIDTIEAQNDITKEARGNGQLSKSSLESQKEKIQKYAELIEALNKQANKIVKNDAKFLERKTCVPRDICTAILKNTPESKYIDRFKVGFFLNIALNDLYSKVNEMNTDIKDVNWREFFKELFGKENLLEVSTFILLEGVHRINGFKAAGVRKVWDSLTFFALKNLENADGNSRTHMIEIYIKRISKMFKNGTFDLRVDLCGLDNREFPNLSKSVTEYKSKIQDIVSAARKSM